MPRRKGQLKLVPQVTVSVVPVGGSSSVAPAMLGMSIVALLQDLAAMVRPQTLYCAVVGSFAPLNTVEPLS
ncbi:MAG: hypothetical protein R3F14_13975 [Polyangiaceae bacterium]